MPSFLAYGVPWIGDEGRKAQIAALQAQLMRLDSLEPRFFHKLADYGEDLRLRPDVTPATPGQHRPG
jgi:NAD(P)H dehydrogenase (quinone)